MRLARDEEVEVPLASLIDIVFLLIIFFVVTTNLQQDVIDRRIELAKSYSIPPLEQGLPPHAITINVGYTGDEVLPRFTIGGANYSLRDIEAMLGQAVRQDGNQVPVVIRADSRIRYRQIQKLNDVIGKSGLYRVSHSAEDYSAYDKLR